MSGGEGRGGERREEEEKEKRKGRGGRENERKKTPFGPSLSVTSHHPDFDLIFVQDRSHFIGCEVDVWLTIITSDKAVSISVALYDTCHFIQWCAGLAILFDS